MFKPIKKVCAIIVAYNGIQWITRCLSSLTYSSQKMHIIVIDNGSVDGTVDIIRNNFPEVELIVSKRNLGFGVANNLGLKKALNEHINYVLLLNQDAWVEPTSVEKLLRVAEENKEFGIICPFHLNYNGSGTETYFKDWVLKHNTPELSKDKIGNNLKPIYASKFVHAACWLISLETVQMIGGFDPLFFHYGEDNDYIQRLHANNKLIGIVPDAKLFHQGTNQGLKNPCDNISFLINQSLLLFKSPSASTSGAVALFFRQFISLHLTEKDSSLSKAYRYNLKRFWRMLQSRKIQKKQMAYL